MPSPFPGMDPFLEGPDIFPDLHFSFIVYLSEALNAVLPPPYYCAIASRSWVENFCQPLEPDVFVGSPQKVAEGEVTEPVVVPLDREEVRQPFLEIHADSSGEHMVTTLEVLCPGNKTATGSGRALYLQKQDTILQSQVHLVEIDLLRSGVHTTIVPLGAAIRMAGFFDYHVCTHRWDRPNICFVYPFQLQGRLPLVAIPLMPEHPPVVVDLKAVLDRVYDSGQYRRRVHYRDAAPPPLLHPNQAVWVEQTLRAAGLIEPTSQTPAP